MKSKLLLLLAAPLLLTGCKAGGSSEAPASSSESSSSSSSSSSGEAPVTSYSFSSVVAAYSDLGIEVTIPNYQGADLKPLQEGTVFYMQGSTVAEMSVYATALTSAGWALTTDEYGDYNGVFGETRATIYLADYKDYADYHNAIVVSFGLAPEEEFPAIQIAEDLGSLGVTDSLPIFSGEGAAAFSWYCESDGIQLAIYCAEDAAESAIIAAYQGDLIAALYTEAGADQYGDMHYSSPNGQLDVVVWAGSDIGQNGVVYVDIVPMP